MRQRSVICFLLAAIMLIYGVRYLPFDGTPVGQAFAWGWTLFAITVIGGNAVQLLYKKGRRTAASVSADQPNRKRIKLRG